jgi:hypothetical protein
VIVLRNFPNYADPFGHNMWFALTLRLAYPRATFVGLYHYRDGKRSPGANLRRDKWKQQTTRTSLSS